MKIRIARLAAILAAGTALSVAACGGEDEPSGGPATSQGDTSTSAPRSPSSGTPTPTDTPPPDPEPRRVTLVATGDVLLHERLWAQAQRDADNDGTWNFAPQLRHIRPVIDGADLAICHLETPLAPKGGPFEGYPTFAGPPRIVPALVETGYDACTTGSNHTFDHGAGGVDRTLDMLDNAGLEHAGSARTEDEAAEPTIIPVETGQGQVDVGLVSYTFSFNGISYPNGQPWRANLIDDEKEILRDAAAARNAGADIVVVAMHWGDEYSHEPNEQQRDLAPRLIASADVDLLLGHHAHVVQPMKRIGGEWVVYGMGNLMANHAEPEGPRSEGLLTRFTFTEDLDGGGFEATAAEYLPLYQTYEPPVEVLSVPQALDRSEYGSAGKARLREALDRTSDVVQRLGGHKAGLKMIGPY